MAVVMSRSAPMKPIFCVGCNVDFSTFRFLLAVSSVLCLGFKQLPLCYWNVETQQKKDYMRIFQHVHGVIGLLRKQFQTANLLLYFVALLGMQEACNQEEHLIR